MKRDNRPLLMLALGGGFVLLLVVVFGPLTRGRGRPMELQPDDAPANRPDVPPWMRVVYLESCLRYTAPDLHVIRPPASAFCYVIDGDVDPATLDALPPAEDYADCWPGVVLCAPDQPALPDGPHACRAGDFYLFGDVELLGRVKAAAESLRFGPYRGVGGPAEPLP